MHTANSKIMQTTLPHGAGMATAAEVNRISADASSLVVFGSDVTRPFSLNRGRRLAVEHLRLSVKPDSLPALSAPERTTWDDGTVLAARFAAAVAFLLAGMDVHYGRAYGGRDMCTQPTTDRTATCRNAPLCREVLWPMMLACAVCIGAQASTVVFDFENDDDLRAWHYERQAPTVPVKELARVQQFATSGTGALKFSSPGWKAGQPEWPSFECNPALKDWSGHDRLVFDVTNATGFDQKLCLFISDSKVPTRQGLLHDMVLPPFGYTRAVITLAQLAEKNVKAADIHVLHVFTERPPGDMALHIDCMVLLKPGETPPVVSPAFLRDYATLFKAQVDAMQKLAGETGERLRGKAAAAPALREWVDKALAEFQQQTADLAALAAKAGPEILDAQPRRERLAKALARVESTVTVRAAFEAVRPAVQADGPKRDEVVFGFATSMEKVLPRAAMPQLTVAAKTELSLARNEKESFQVVVMPCERDLKQVRVCTADLKTADGKTFAASNVDAVVVGYVETKRVPPYGSSHVGWWPDPILNFLKTADIAAGDAQAFWVRVRAPKDQPAGLYQGRVAIEMDGAKAFSFELAVRVRDFCLPDRTPLPLAVTFAPMFFNEQGKEGPYKDPSWQKHKLEWGDFLADYYLTYDSLYHHEAPGFEVLERLNKQGRLGMFNLGYYVPAEENAAALEKWKESTLPRLRAGYDKAKSLGLLKHAYIYGCDEAPEKLFPTVQRAAELLKAAFPDVLVMTTTYDHSFGTDSVIRSMDAFCPLTPKFDQALAAKARAVGKQVWWYICCGPHHPHANMFIEYPAIEGRLLMGAMTARYRPDGFLYYEISIWNSEPIESGPFTAWNPRSWTTYHGDGSWTCLGPDGTPLPTIRLENFRDGLEDYAYFRILEATAAKVEASPELRAQKGEWLQQAKALLTVPPSVVKSLTDYSRNPGDLYSYRAALAGAIEGAGVPPADPWAAGK